MKVFLGRVVRLVFCLSVLSLVGIGACLGLFLLIRHSALGEGAAVHGSASAYLRDVRAGRYAQAYARLCSDGNVGTAQAFAERLQRDRAAGHGLTGYDLHVTVTKETFDLTTAAGSATFADGTREPVQYELRRVDAGDPGCLLTFDDLSVG